jgi:hypothetical protein
MSIVQANIVTVKMFEIIACERQGSSQPCGFFGPPVRLLSCPPPSWSTHRCLSMFCINSIQPNKTFELAE